MIVVALMVVVSLSSGYLFGISNSGRQVTNTHSITTTQTIVTTTTYVSFQACNSPYSTSIIKGTTSNTSVIVFDTNSTAFICADFLNPTSSATISYQYPSATVWTVKNGEWVSSTGLNVTIQPSPFQIPPNSTSWYVFQIVPLNMTQAVYLVGLPTVCSGWVVVSVGYSVTKLQHTVLSFPDITEFCPAVFAKPTIVGITNLIPTYSE